MNEPIDPGLAVVVATLGVVVFFGLTHLWQRRRAAQRRRVLESSARLELPVISELQDGDRLVGGHPPSGKGSRSSSARAAPTFGAEAATLHARLRAHSSRRSEA